jgi:hypothetical protein
VNGRHVEKAVTDEEMAAAEAEQQMVDSSAG